MKRFIIYIFGTLALGLLTHCTELPSVLVDVEPSLSVLSGTVAATKDFGLVAQLAPRPKALPKFPRLFGLVEEAYASTPDCPGVNGNGSPTSYCENETLVVFYDNCQSTTLEKAGLRRMYTRIAFDPSLVGICSYINTNGFDTTALTTLQGTTFTRTYGMGPGGDQQNIRFNTSTNEAAYVYSDYPSGWKEDRTGGVSITVDGTDYTKRTMVVNGVHAKSALHLDNPVPDTQSFDLLNIKAPEDTKSARYIWNHTINTVKSGDALFEIGPTILGSPGSSIDFSVGLSAMTTASFDGDIVVTGTGTSTTVQKGALLRAQHNISKGIALVLVTEDLVWGDSNCCWPSSGTVRGEHDRSLSRANVSETLVFTGSSCGSIDYTTINGKSPIDQLHHCF